MKNDNIIQQKSFAFAIEVIKEYKLLTTEKKEFVLSRQLLRSATAIGANIEESIGAQSKPDFFHKITLSYKEARETIYWIKLLGTSDYLSKSTCQKLLSEAEEICRILGKIQLSLKKNING